MEADLVMKLKTKEETVSDSKLRCPECGGTTFIRDYRRAELICANCGLVIQDKLIDSGPEWRAFDFEQHNNRARVGSPTTYMLHDKGLSTFIDWRNQDIYGNKFDSRKRAKIYKLRKWQRRIRISNAIERNLAYALSELERMASYLGLPQNIRETAAMIYRNAVERRLIRGRSIEGMTAAAIYAACRSSNVPRTLDEIASVSRVTKKEIGRSYRFIARELKITPPPTNPVYYVPRFIQQLSLPQNVQNLAIEILQKANTLGLTSGRGPHGVAAAAIYIASVLLNKRCTQRDVAEVARVTEVTVRNRYKELVDKLQLNIPSQ